MSKIGIKPDDRVIGKGITRIQNLVDDLKREVTALKNEPAVSLDNYTTREYVTNAVSTGTTGLSSTSYVDTKVAGLASETYVASSVATGVSGLASTTYVDNAVASGGGTSYWIWQKNGRQYTRYDNWYFGANTTYGVTSTQWNATQNSSSLPTSWFDNTNPGIVVPKDCTLKDWTFTGNFQTSQTYQFALMKGTHPTFGSAGNYSLSQIGATQEEASATLGILYEIGQTGLSVSLEKGDIILPCFRRTTEDSSTYRYLEMAFSVVCEIS